MSVLEALCLLRAVLHLHFGESQLTANAFQTLSWNAAVPRCFLPCPLRFAPHLRLKECHIMTVPAWCHPPAPQRLWFLSAVQPGIGDPELHQVRDGGT